MKNIINSTISFMKQRIQSLGSKVQASNNNDNNNDNNVLIDDIQLSLLKKKQTIQINKKTYQHQKLFLYPIFDNNYLLYCKDLLNNSYFWHFHKNGQVLKQYKTKMSQNAHLITDRQVLFLQYEFKINTYYIVQWNFDTNTVIKCVHKSFNNDGDGKLIVFAQTKLIFIVQRTINFDENRILIKISCYNYPLTQQSNPIHIQLKSMTSLSNSFILGRKINNNSSLVWVQSLSQNQYTHIHIFNMYNTPKFKTYKINHFFNQKPQLFQSILTDIWEMKQNQLYLKFKVQLSDIKLRIQFNNQSGFFNYANTSYEQTQKQLKQKQKQFQIIWKYQQQIQNYHIAKFSTSTLNNNNNTYKQKHKKQQHYIQFVNGFRQIQKVYKPWDLPSSQAKQIQILYIDPDTQQVQAIQSTNKYFIQTSKSTYPLYNSKISLDYHIHLQTTLTKFQITSKKLRSLGFNIRMLSCFFLSQCIENCDEDLLYQVTNIVYKNKIDMYQEN